MKVLVCGSRTWDDSEAIRERLAQLPDRFSLIVGDAKGADQIAEREGYRALSERRCRSVTYCRAYWHIHGRRAGILRNLHMLDYEPDLVIAFWDGKSRGTKHTINTARERGIPVEIVT